MTNRILDAAVVELAAPTIAFSDGTLYRPVLRTVIQKTGLADNVATPVFTITTVNETGDTDGGTYICHVVASCSHGSSNNTANSATRYWAGHFARAMMQTGAGSNSAVIEEYDDAEAATAIVQRGVASVTVTVAETSEYVQTVSFQIDLSGAAIADGQVTAEVTVLWHGFLAPPIIAVA